VPLAALWAMHRPWSGRSGRRSAELRITGLTPNIQPCLPAAAERPPCGPQWVYEVKHDGYRLIVWKTADRVRIFTRRGADWTQRFPRIVEAVSRLRASSIVVDGEGVTCREDGVSDFDALHSKLETLLRRSGVAGGGILLNEYADQDGARVFEHACLMGLEGIVCKRIDLSYRSSRSKVWIKVRNPKAPAATRIEDGTF
jgi:bifunctional non-homologous end joining protein LigD